MAKFVDSNGCKALANALIGSTKTINGQSIWGSGNISISGGGGVLTNTLDIELEDYLDISNPDDVLADGDTENKLPNLFYSEWKKKNSGKTSTDFYNLLMSGAHMKVTNIGMGMEMNMLFDFHALPGTLYNTNAGLGVTGFILMGTGYGMSVKMNLIHIVAGCTFLYTVSTSPYPFNVYEGEMFSSDITAMT